ncbi:hypothetical protein PGTUg99_010198 [Puccinia graminis f. sp. tritici]|uniref:Uncharacterized protein n=1 Tax=Puccinia graminis f. sp. tritici TaxID=56615 RepID=A0A5B0QE97_PUCGR|nr:hypothetical protein PGTUg99_010198 [Puccinia graminis f. sp. tritici]
MLLRQPDSASERHPVFPAQYLSFHSLPPIFNGPFMSSLQNHRRDPRAGSVLAQSFRMLKSPQNRVCAEIAQLSFEVLWISGAKLDDYFP